jgi:hypothetical protein
MLSIMLLTNVLLRSSTHHSQQNAQCFFHSFCKANDALYLLPLFCAVDYRWQQLLPPGSHIAFSRPR